MRKNYFWMMLIAMASILGFSACSSDEDGPSKDILGARHHVEIMELDFALYDFTVSYTDLMSETVKTEKMVTPTWNYQCVRVGAKRPSPYILKIVGTPKPNAASIAKDLAAKGNAMKASAVYDFHAGIAVDMSLSDFFNPFVSVKSTQSVSVSADRIEEYLSKHNTITVIDINK